MKNIFRIYAAAVLAVLVCSCGRSVEFEHQTFATFYASTYSVAENAGEISIPVQIYNPNKGEVQVAIRAVDGEGENGAKMNENYRVVSPENGLLTFSGDVDSLDIVVAIVDEPGVRSASKDFSLLIESVTEGIPTGALQSAKVVIRDMDHPLAHFIGQWSGSTKAQETGTEYSFNFTFDSVEGDDNALALEFADPVLAPTVSYMTVQVETVNGPIVIPSLSYVGAYGDYQCYYSGLSTVGMDNTSDFSDIYMDYSRNAKTLKISNGFGLFVPVEGYYAYLEIYLGGMVLTKR